MQIQPTPHKIILPTIKGLIFKNLKDVSYFKSDDIYCTMYNMKGEHCFISKPLKWVEHRLQAHNFYRVHNSYLINVYNIEQYRKEGNDQLWMECGAKIPISRSKRGELMVFFGY